MLARTLQGSNTFVGVRAEESPRRANDLATNGVIFGKGSAKVCRPIGSVSTTSVWNYLEHNIDGIGVNYNKLLEYYNGDTRDGCFFCYAAKYPQGATDLRSAITLRLREFFDPKKGDPRRFCYSNTINRNRVDVCKLLYNELIEAQDYYKEYLLTDLHKKYIFELWNIYENIIGERGVKGLLYARDFLKAYFNGSYKPLYPELFELSFRKVKERYYYRVYDIYEGDRLING